MIKGLFQFIFGLIRLAFFVLIFLLIFHTWTIKQILKFSLSYNLGADVSIQKVKMDWKNTGFEVLGIEIENPYSFPEGVLADIPLAIFSLDLPRLSKKEIRFKAVGFNLRTLEVMNVPQKGLNILALKPLQKSEKDESSAQTVFRDQIQKQTPVIVINELIFSVEDIVYKDMRGSSISQREFQANIRGATYYNIKEAGDIVLIIAAEAMKKIGFNYLDAQLKKLQESYVPSKDSSDNFLTKALNAFK